VVTCEIKLFQNYFNLRRRPSEILFQCVRTSHIISKLLISEAIAAHEYFPTSSLK